MEARIKLKNKESYTVKYFKEHKYVGSILEVYSKDTTYIMSISEIEIITIDN